MPILPAEPQIFPPNLLDQSIPPWSSEPHSEEDDDPDQPRWWCLHTKPRQEKVIARDFRDNQMAYYLPQVVKESRTPAGRRIRSILPLFPSYLFFWGDFHQKLEAIRNDRLVSVLKVKDQLALHEDLKQIHRMLSSGLPVVPEPEFPIGSWVRITSGRLEGMVGKVEKRGNRDHFIALVRLLGRGVSVELEPWQVEAFDPDARN